MKGTLSHKISVDTLVDTCTKIYQQGDRLQMAYALYPTGEQHLEGAQQPEVLYFATMGSKKPFYLWRVKLDHNQVLPSLSRQAPLLGWYEREMHDLFDIYFQNHPELYPLVLHDGAKSLVPPMHPDYKHDTLIGFTRKPWHLPQMGLADLQLLPFGPVRAAVCESAEFLFLYAGESILHFYERLFFKHRGMEKRFEGLNPLLAVVLAERVSGVGSVAHALAFCQAVETASLCEVPKRAQRWRVILAELERLYNHLHYLGHLCHTTTLKVGESQGMILEEQIKQLNARITGSRFLRSIITPGGLRREPSIAPLTASLSVLQKDILTYTQSLLDTNTHVDRLIGTGILSKQIAFDEGATGPVARASGIATDFRSDHPYAAYEEFTLAIACDQTGDAMARMTVRIAEIKQSLELIHNAIASLAPGPIMNLCTVPAQAEGLGWVESPRGGLFYAVHFDDQGLLSRVKIKSPSFSNWRVFPFTVDESNMMDYAINEASFGSTISGCDR